MTKVRIDMHLITGPTTKGPQSAMKIYRDMLSDGLFPSGFMLHNDFFYPESLVNLASRAMPDGKSRDSRGQAVFKGLGMDREYLVKLTRNADPKISWVDRVKSFLDLDQLEKYTDFNLISADVNLVDDYRSFPLFIDYEYKHLAKETVMNFVTKGLKTTCHDLTEKINGLINERK